MNTYESNSTSHIAPVDSRPMILVLVPHAETRTSILKTLGEETPYQVFCARDTFWVEQICRIIHPHLVLLEHHLPETNGVQVYHSLQRIPALATVPALLLLPDPAALSLHDCKKRGLYVLCSPWQHEEFLTALEGALDASSVPQISSVPVAWMEGFMPDSHRKEENHPRR